MRVLVWITEGGWEACVDAARRLDTADVTLICAASDEVVGAERGALAGLLGRRHPPHVEERLERLSAEAAEALLAAAAERLGRGARRVLASGPVERAVTDAAREADLLVAARSTRHTGPKSIRHPERFVVDHVPCALLLVWPGQPDHAAPGPH